MTKILLLEDDLDDVRAIERALRREKVAIERFDTLKASLAFLRSQKVDVILADLNVYDSSSLETFDRLAEVADMTPVIILSGYAEDQLALDAVRQGAQDFLRKDEISTTTLKASIAYAIERSKIADRLKTAERNKTEFLAHFSHEIRTPLNAVVGMTSVLAECLEKKENQKIVQSIQLGADRLLAIVNDILDLSKIEAGEMDVDAELMNPRQSIEKILHLFAAQAVDKRIYLTNCVSQQVPAQIATDATKFEQIVSNLVSNAIKFTEAGSVVVFADLIKDGLLRVEVRDTGPGMSEEDQAGIFRPFSQARAARKERAGQKGTGLGLAICQKLAALLGGTCGLDSKEGQGSTFWFTVSFEQTAMARNARSTFDKLQVAVIGAEGTVGPELVRRQLLARGVASSVYSWDEAENCTETVKLLVGDGPDNLSSGPSAARIGWHVLSEAESEVGFPPTQSKLYSTVAKLAGESPVESVPAPDSEGAVQELPSLGEILVVDDDPLNRKVLTKMLSALNVASVTATNGSEALEIFSSDKHSLIFMDCSMPEMDGFEATRRLRDQGCDACIVALTAHAFQDDRDRCLEAGMDQFLCKPIRIDDIKEVLAEVGSPSEFEDD